MDKKTNKIKKIVRKYATLLKKRMRLSKIILFGSYAYGKPHRYSDIDLAIISPDLGKKNEMEEMTELLKLAHCINLDIEAHPYHPTEFKNPHPSTLAYEILKKGKVVYSE